MPAPANGERPRLPAVERLLAEPVAAEMIARSGRTAVVHAIRSVLAGIRTGEGQITDPRTILRLVEAHLADEARPSLRPVFNLTGTVLHTNLGRAPLPPEAAKAVAAAMTGSCNLEFDLGSGERGERDHHVEDLICRLTGAEAAIVVNNNAAAVFLTLFALARRKEVVVSRGELVEIGGSFRVPDVMASAGCRLREVGTTNRTHLRDYADAIGPRTGLVMKVHRSNYEIRGFTKEVAEPALAAFCSERRLPFVVDLGSGNLIDLSVHGLPAEPIVRDVLAQADLVTFSGDKLLGAVQCGIVAGRRDLVARLRKNPLKRALRVDKMTYAALEAVLRLYLHPERLAERLPTLRLLTRAPASIRDQAERLLPQFRARLGTGICVTIEPCMSQIGSGALPVDTMPSFCLAMRPPDGMRKEGAWLKDLAAALRSLPMPVIGRIHEGALRLDLRTLEDEAGLLEQLSLLQR